jgi:hypothetical protein
MTASSTSSELMVELKALSVRGRELPALVDPRKIPAFQRIYQAWYSSAFRVVRLLAPERAREFEELYLGHERSRGKSAWSHHDTIQGFLLHRFVASFGHDAANTTRVLIQNQLAILESLSEIAASRIANLEGILQADLFDSELDAARELLKAGHIRAAGALAGVTLEAHLARLSRDRGIAIRKKTPTIADLNDALRDAGVYDTPQWRLIQRLGDLRNLASHKKERDPSADEMQELILSADKLTKTLV